MNLKLRTHKVGSANVVEVAGEVELHNAELLRDELLRAGQGEHPCLVVDLSRVSFIDSTGVGVLVGAFKRVREIGTLSVVCPQRNVRRIFEITGLTKVFMLHNSVESALAECAVSPAVSPAAASAAASAAANARTAKTPVAEGETHA